VERRKEPRFQIDQTARITNLRTREVLDAQLLNISGRGARVSVPSQLPINTPLRIDVGDVMLLGDVCYCRMDAINRFSVGVALAHSIFEMESLGRLMQRLTQEYGSPVIAEAAATKPRP